MIALAKLIIVLMLSIFSGEPSEQTARENSKHVKLIQDHKKEQPNKCIEACIPA